MKSIKKYRILLGLFLLPLFFIQVKNTHDWGDDFAQYIIQAKNIIEGNKQTDNGLYFDEHTPIYAINAYPVGFPLLISPIYKIYGLQIFPYLLLIAGLLYATGFVCFEFFRKRTSLFFSFMLSLLFCYNLQVLELKKQILSEIPFTLFIMTLFTYFNKDVFKRKYAILAVSILLAWITSLRLAGMAAYIGFILFGLFDILKTRKGWAEKSMKIFLIALVSPVLFHFLNDIIFNVGTKNLFNFYSENFQNHPFNLIQNLNRYLEVSKTVFPLFGFWIPSIWIICSLAGWILKTIQSVSLAEFVFPVYSIMILLYPYESGGARFLIPILPLLIFYLGYFLKYIFSAFGNKSNLLLAAFYSILWIGSLHAVVNLVQHQDEIEDGPQKEISGELFTFVKSTPQNSLFVFCRARAFYLYTNRPVFYSLKEQSSTEMFNQFQKQKSLFIIIPNKVNNNSLFDQKLEDVILLHREHYNNVWSNAGYDIYLQI
jgi:hypothetical protein